LLAVQGIDFVSVNYRSEDALFRLAESLQGLAATIPGCGLVVVDCSGSADRLKTLRLIGDLPVEIFDPGENVGFARAANLGFRTSRSDVVVFVNPDVEIDPRATRSLLQQGMADGAVAWTGVLHNADGSVQLNTAPPPSLGRQALEYLLGIDTRLAEARHVREVGVISGALLCVRADAFRAIGGFDETFPLYVEDVDLCVRLARLGRLVQFPVPAAIHVGGVSAKTAPRATAALLHASRVRFYRRRSRWAGLIARATVLAGCAARRLLRPGDRSLDMDLLLQATRSSFPLESLLPARTDAGPVIDGRLM
jgi:N-acetylglucosaminyl-diphospho-decaprenol L-rhamnosyltransferase